MFTQNSLFFIFSKMFTPRNKRSFEDYSLSHEAKFKLLKYRRVILIEELGMYFINSLNFKQYF